MKSLINLLKETIKDGSVICDSCGWSWKLSEGGNDPYTCHKCGHDNTPKMKPNNFERIIDKFSESNPSITKQISQGVKKFIYEYLSNKGYNVKLLNACTSYAGVRTKDQIIICSPNMMQSLGDFIYTLFHEIRHEQQISEIKMKNPLSEMDLDDFEQLYKSYWEMELDADQYAKNMLKQLIVSLKLEKENIPSIFKVSHFIENYPQASNMVKMSLQGIIQGIKSMKSQGQDYEDIQDHPAVKPFISKLESFL